MTEAPERHWSEISPQEARNYLLPHPGIKGPINEAGEPCPWPWEPQQLTNAPMGQYHCPYCGAMVIAGVPHTDWTVDDE